ncbi:MAG: ABC transporter permease [Gammaproteobacteria bacterium]|nr:MAG: ABC transporter permease [Gammaproteobacteria bacterium]
MNARGAWVVFRKEVTENLRDRRAVMSALLYGPLIGPLMFAGMMTMVLKVQEERAEAPLEIPVAGQDNAPNLITFLRQQGAQIQPAPADAEAAVRAQDEEVVLVIPETFAEQFRAGEPATVRLILDESRRESGTKIRRVTTLLDAYSRQIGLLRLQARGVNPAITRALAVEEVDLSTAESRSVIILGMLPYFVMLALFVGGMYLAIDTTAGEKERGSMEPLLINPVSRGAIMSGKLAATVVFSLASLMLTLVAFAFSLGWVPADSLGISIDLSATKVIALFLIVAPVALLASGLQTIIASFAKGFREAQTYLSILMLVPMIPVVVLLIMPVKAKTWMMTVPILSQTMLIEKVVRGELIPTVDIAISVLCTTALGLIFAVLAARLYDREQMLQST